MHTNVYYIATTRKNHFHSIYVQLLYSNQFLVKICGASFKFRTVLIIFWTILIKKIYFWNFIQSSRFSCFDIQIVYPTLGNIGHLSKSNGCNHMTIHIHSIAQESAEKEWSLFSARSQSIQGFAPQKINIYIMLI